jgi:hypothetical protein
VRALTRQTHLLGQVRDRAVVLADTPDQLQAAEQGQTGITV